MRVIRYTTLTCLIVAGLVVWRNLGCDVDREVFAFDPAEGIFDYIEHDEVGREFFTTEYLFPESTYTKPTDPDAVFRDVIDSTSREIHYTSGNNGYFGTGVNDISYAEVTVTDVFLMRTERIAADSVTFQFNWRTVNRRGLFLQVGSSGEKYLGWLLYAFNGGIPRNGYIRAFLEDNSSFAADGLNYDQIRYFEIITYDTLDLLGNRHTVVDTVARETVNGYVALDDIPSMPPGDSLFIRAEGIDGNSPTGSVYALVSAETDQGLQISRMSMPDQDHYFDTLVTPINNPREWNLILFQEFVKPDHIGAVWVVPYRTGD